MDGVAVCVPYAPRNPHETALWNVCRERWHALGLPCYTAGVEYRGRFNRSGSRNLAASNAIADGATTLIFSNADTSYLDPADVAKAVQHARNGGWSLPDFYVENSERMTTRILAGEPLSSHTLEPVKSWTEWPRGSGLAPPAGPQVMSAAFWEVVKWDPAFVHLGYEDAAIREALDTLCAPHARIGTSVHLHHSRSAEESYGHRNVRENRRRYQMLYRRNIGKPAQMAEVVSHLSATP